MTMDTSKIENLFASQLVAVNIGPRLFGEALEKQGVEVVQVDWKPAAGGELMVNLGEMQDILSALGGF